MRSTRLTSRLATKSLVPSPRLIEQVGIGSSQYINTESGEASILDVNNDGVIFTKPTMVLDTRSVY